MELTIYPNGLNNGFSSKFCVSSQVWHDIPKEGWRTHWQKPYEYNNEDEDNSPNILSDKNYQASSQKFRHRILSCFFTCCSNLRSFEWELIN